MMLRLLISSNLRPPSVFTTTMRERKRMVTKLKLRMLHQKQKAKKAAEKVLEVRKPDDFNSRLEQRKLRKFGVKTLSPCLAYPSRLLKSSTNFLDGQPKDDVVRLSFHDQIFSFHDSIMMHKEIQHPTIYNNIHAPLILRLDLNMNLDSVGDDFVESSQKIISLPHKFDISTKRTLMVFSKSPEKLEAASEAGAEFVCGPDMIKKILKGHVKIDDVDYFLATVDIMRELGTLRGLMKKKFPTTLNGALGLEPVELVNFFRYGVDMEIKRDDSTPEWGICKAIVGKLSMPIDNLEENVGAFIKNVCEHRPLAASLGHFIYRAVLTVPDGKEYHQIDFTKYAPPVPDNDAALMTDDDEGKKKKKKKKKKG